MAETPEFDFSEVSYGWNKEFMHNQTAIMEAQLLLSSEPKEELNGTDIARVQLGKLEAAAGIEGLINTRDEQICEILVSVPRDWLVKKAPPDLDWSDVATLNWLKIKRFNDLIEAMNEAMSADSKN